MMIQVHLATFVAVVRARGRDRSSRELHHVPDTHVLDAHGPHDVRVDEADVPHAFDLRPTFGRTGHASRHASPLDPPLDPTPPESSS